MSWAGNIEGFAVLIAECQVGESHSFRSGNLSQALAGWRYDPHAPHACRIDVPCDVHLHAVGATRPLFAREINKKPAIFDRAVRLDVISKDLPLIWTWPPIIDVENLFVRGKCEAVRRKATRIFVQELQTAISNEVHTVERQLLRGIILPLRKTTGGAIREVDCAIGFHDNIVWTGEALSFKVVRQRGTLAILLQPLDCPVSCGVPHNPALSI